MRPGCIVRDGQGRLGRLISMFGELGAVSSFVEVPAVPGIRVNPRLDAVPLRDLVEVQGPVSIGLGIGVWQVRAHARQEVV